MDKYNVNNNSEIAKSLRAMGISKSDSEELRKNIAVEDGDGVIKPSDYNKPRKQVEITKADRIAAVELGLVPKKDEDAVFDVDKITKNIQRYGLKSYYSVKKFPVYVEVVNHLLSTIRSGQLPRQSYIIGAPNGFGKSKFANEAIITMNKLGWGTVPFTSLTELAELWVYTENKLLSNFSSFSDEDPYEGQDYALEYSSTPGVNYNKKPKVVLPRYSWSEYMNAECLICYFTTFDCRNIEARILLRIMIERGTKGLPTIVCISSSFNPYAKDRQLKQYVWDEILLSSKVLHETTSRLKHVSCFKVIKNPFDKNTKEDGNINDYDPNKDLEFIAEQKAAAEKIELEQKKKEELEQNKA